MTPEEPDESQEILEATLPGLLLPLAQRGLIRESDLENPRTLYNKVQENIEIVKAEVRFTTSLEDEFVAAACQHWGSSQKEIAVVLFSTAVEQHINFALRSLLNAKNIERDKITDILKSTNFEGKLTWLLRLCGEAQLSDKMVKRLKQFAKVRNAIVHFKALGAHPDTDEDSLGLIEKEMVALKDIEDLAAVFEELRQEFSILLRLRSAALDLALKASQVIVQFLRSRQR